MTNDKSAPSASSFTSAPRRNHLALELAAPVTEVWALVGDLGRLPQYSAGLDRVAVEKDRQGNPTAYVCHFKPMADGEQGIVSRDFIRWHEEGRGWASLAEEPNAFGARNSVHRVTVAPSAAGTTLTWDAHYDADDLDANRIPLDQAFADIGARLVARFGGRVVERTMDAAK
jgi:hypothetical protein